MNNILRNKVFIISILFFIVGVVFIILENTFYQYLDENSVLQESFFLPLGFLFIFIGFLGFIFLILKYLYLKIK